MPKVFVSHAFADRAYATQFVELVLEGGCDLGIGDIFYSSLPEAGVPAGETLLTTVRDELLDAGLVIALITPVYFSRPACVAELGVAWGLTENLVPLLAPGMSHRDADGVLGDRLVVPIHDGSQLDVLRDRITEVTGRDVETARWNRWKYKWLKIARDLAEQLAKPMGLNADEALALRAERDGLEEARAAAEAEAERLAEVVERLMEATDADERAAALVPDDAVERVEHYRDALVDALHGLPSVVAEAVFLEGADEVLLWKHGLDDLDGTSADIDAAVKEGHLKHYQDDAFVSLDSDSVAVEQATNHYADLAWALEEAPQEYKKWFRDVYGHPPDLARRAVWDALVLSRRPVGPK